ncbi:hypothetical protein CONLIGDRAFT_344022 [Coniochaeta ligniaria NRRL 30616]|uniref:Uncharacterized protein n=1 Tax=Coniochaeta ligniaria NRRL 30616 TaxID=1408157 RepID=A0A1J7JKG0_9PEZI|nr:hypothetical protein CONLIGDRAFT_344022 [Coniochaeta ligniaria NRRL 30616]
MSLGSGAPQWPRAINAQPGLQMGAAGMLPAVAPSILFAMASDRLHSRLRLAIARYARRVHDMTFFQPLDARWTGQHLWLDNGRIGALAEPHQPRPVAVWRCAKMELVGRKHLIFQVLQAAAMRLRRHLYLGCQDVAPTSHISSPVIPCASQIARKIEPGVSHLELGDWWRW